MKSPETVVACTSMALCAAAGLWLCWMLPDPAGSPFVYAMFLLAAVAAGSAVYLLRRREQVPDLLAAAVGTDWYETRGLCYAFLCGDADGDFALLMFFQSRYAGACDARVTLRHKPKGTTPLPDLTASWRCPPGGFGAVVLPLAAPAALGGAEQTFRFGVSVRWPDGKGRQLRHRRGDAVTVNADLVDWQGRLGLLLAAVLSPLNLVWLLLPGRGTPSVRVPLPRRLAAAPPGDPEVRIRWEYDLAMRD